jgi:uncharacterized protein YjbJ (UPF0337 family)
MCSENTFVKKLNLLKMATKLTIKGNWDEMKGKLKQKFAILTDDDLLFIKGKEEELLGRLEKKLGQTKEQIRHAIEKL